MSPEALREMAEAGVPVIERDLRGMDLRGLDLGKLVAVKRKPRSTPAC